MKQLLGLFVLCWLVLPGASCGGRDEHARYPRPFVVEGWDSIHLRVTDSNAPDERGEGGGFRVGAKLHFEDVVLPKDPLNLAASQEGMFMFGSLRSYPGPGDVFIYDSWPPESSGTGVVVHIACTTQVDGNIQAKAAIHQVVNDKWLPTKTFQTVLRSGDTWSIRRDQ